MFQRLHFQNFLGDVNTFKYLLNKKTSCSSILQGSQWNNENVNCECNPTVNYFQFSTGNYFQPVTTFAKSTILLMFDRVLKTFLLLSTNQCPVDTVRKLNVLYTFNLRLVSTGKPVRAILPRILYRGKTSCGTKN